MKHHKLVDELKQRIHNGEKNLKIKVGALLFNTIDHIGISSLVQLILS